jgi:hypothetical protein
MSTINQFRKPEYTGKNRCTPCTAVNIGIAFVASALAAFASPVLGVGIFALSLATIYLRGYLVPGTPTLTKQYFPEHVLRWFDKGSTSVADASVDIDPERVLLEAGAVEPCRERTDLRLTTEFRETWRNRVNSSDTDEFGAGNLKNALDAPHDEIAITDLNGAYVAHADDSVIGQWSSQATVAADATAATVLAKRYSGWDSLNPAEKARVLMSLRIFIEQCPECGGPVVVEQEVVESCCRSYDVIASACQDCETRLFEMEWNDDSVTEAEEHPNQEPIHSASA